MWVREGEPRPEQEPAPVAAKTPHTEFGKPQTAALDVPGEGQRFLLSLNAGGKTGPARFLKPGDSKPLPAKVPRSAKPLYSNEEFVKWCRENAIDAVAVVAERMQMQAEAGASPLRANTALQLIGLDVLSMRVLPRAFDEMSVEKARDVLGRSPQKPSTQWMTIDINLAEPPDTFLIQTRDGTLGLLQIEETDKAPGKLTVTWKLHRGK